MSKLIDTLLARVVLHEESDQQFLFLRERGGTRGFPIVIGNHEAHEIQRLLNRQATERPLTHQLLHACLEALGAQLEHVEVTALRGPTFYASLLLRAPGKEELLRVDARPSDAIALALRAGCPLRVTEEVMALAGRPTGASDEDDDEDVDDSQGA